MKIPWKGKLTLTFVRRGFFFISTVATVVDLGGAWNHPQCCESGWARIVLLFPWGHWLKGAVLLKIIPTDNFSESDKRDWEVLPAGAGCSHWVEGKDWEQRLRSSSSLSAPGSRKLFRNGRFQLSGGNYFGNHEKARKMNFPHCDAQIYHSSTVPAPRGNMVFDNLQETETETYSHFY